MPQVGAAARDGVYRKIGGDWEMIVAQPLEGAICQVLSPRSLVQLMSSTCGIRLSHSWSITARASAA